VICGLIVHTFTSFESVGLLDLKEQLLNPIAFRSASKSLFLVPRRYRHFITLVSAQLPTLMGLSLNYTTKYQRVYIILL